MAKIDNAVRIVEFETEYDLYSQMEIDRNHAILYFEEDPNIIMARFIHNKEILNID